MSRIRDMAASCEAKLHGFRRTADGVVVSFVLNPVEVPQALALDPLGSRYMLAFVAISDTEEPIAPGKVAEQSPLVASERSARAKQKYASSTERQQAVVRSARYPKDERFRAWVAKATGWGACEEPDAAQFIRDECRVSTRSDIATDDLAYAAFLRIETAYKIHAGLMPEVR